MKIKQATETFSKVYQKTFNEAYGYILAITGDAKNAPDLLKASYTTFYRHLLRTKFRNDESYRNTLFKFIRRELNKHNRSSAQSTADKPSRIKKYQEFIAEELQADIPMPQGAEELEEILGDILDLVSKKSTEKRRAFLLYYLYDFSIEKVAKELSISEMTAGNHILEITKEIHTKYLAPQADE